MGRAISSLAVIDQLQIAPCDPGWVAAFDVERERTADALGR
jgi:hypothetical protein